MKLLLPIDDYQNQTGHNRTCKKNLMKRAGCRAQNDQLHFVGNTDRSG